MSSSTSMRVQKQRENELRRMTKAIPEAIRAGWGLHDYAEELKARQPRLFNSMVGTNAERFFRLQKVVKIPEQQTLPLAEPQHAAYHEPAPSEDPMAKAWAEVQARIDKDCQAITGKPREMVLHKNQLNICTGYQRERMSMAKVEKIAIAPNWTAFNHLVVAHRDGKYWVVDGQHRWAAACKRNDMDQLPCLVFDSKGEADEAALFVMINLQRTNVPAMDRFRAFVRMGDKAAREVAQCLEALDIQIVSHAGGARQLSCINKVYNLGARDMRQCELVMSVTQELSTQIPVGGDLVDALAYIDRNAVDGLMNPMLLVRLKKLGIHKILDLITKAKTQRTGQPAGAMILGEVNRGLPLNKRIKVRNLVEAADDD